jgi:2-polyprenyl-3-methyl-5-hydroxy-6-metoxy-1,4-benzoquinol methylase
MGDLTASSRSETFPFVSELVPRFRAFRRQQMQKGTDEEPFEMPLFSSNPLKRFVVERKYNAICKSLAGNPKRRTVLDFGPGFGALLPTLSSLYEHVTAIEAFDDQLTVARDLVAYFGLRNAELCRVEVGSEFASLESNSFDAIVAADVLEHLRNWKGSVLEIKRVLAPGGLLIVSLPMEHIIYRLFARKEVEHDAIRGHLYHSMKGERELERYILGEFALVRRISIFSFFHLLILRRTT